METRKARKGKGCRGKASHTSRDNAEKARLQMVREGATRLRAYPCRHCGNWHVGHPPGSATSK